MVPVPAPAPAAFCLVLLFVQNLSLQVQSHAFEVVGGTGRVGSLWLRENGSMATPRGISPGCLSDQDQPIYVAIPSRGWSSIYRQTLAHRREDLVFVGNGLLNEYQKNSTVVVPHFGVLVVGQDPVTSPSSPHTFIYGKHSEKVAAFLRKKRVQVEIVSSWMEISQRAARKLLWATVMWLLCHSRKPPISVFEVHREHKNTLAELVRELLYPLSEIVGFVQEEEATMQYLRNYSLSMPRAIPSKDLALSEVSDRNGVFLQYESEENPQPTHRKLLATVTKEKVNVKTATESNENEVLIDLTDICLSVVGEIYDSHETPRKVAIVGSGVMGSAVALNLARQGVKNITVYDSLPQGILGKTTSASWAWINANQKQPHHYKLLNQLGMWSWRHDRVLVGLPSWKGSLVRTKDSIKELGGYPMEGPLTGERVLTLEACANLTVEDGSFIYFFPTEGSVDPLEAVKALQKESKRLGVRFVTDTNVTGIVFDSNKASGVRLERNGKIHVEVSDMVVVAAGRGAADRAFGGLPLVDSPGRISFAKPRTKLPRLKRLIVDTVDQSHILQRDDGTLVAGGGELQVGGTRTVSGFSSDGQGSTSLMGAARNLAPSVVENADVVGCEEAQRPMPKDGLPIVGFVAPGLYSVVSHSGMTLAPVLSVFIATEITKNVRLAVLDNYRPTRFAETSDAEIY